MPRPASVRSSMFVSHTRAPSPCAVRLRIPWRWCSPCWSLELQRKAGIPEVELKFPWRSRLDECNRSSRSGTHGARGWVDKQEFGGGVDNDRLTRRGPSEWRDGWGRAQLKFGREGERRPRRPGRGDENSCAARTGLQDQRLPVRRQRVVRFFVRV